MAQYLRCLCFARSSPLRLLSSFPLQTFYEKAPYGIHAPTALPAKEAFGHPPFKTEFPFGGSKYPELFLSPSPQSLALNVGVNVYPVDTVIPQLPPTASQKQELVDASFPSIAGKSAAAPSAQEPDNFLAGTDADFNSIFFGPPSKEKLEDTALDLAIPSDVSYLLDMFSEAAATPGAAEVAPAFSTEIPVPGFWDVPSKLPLEGAAKGTTESEPAASPVTDPLFSELYRDGNAVLSPDSFSPKPNFSDLLLYGSPPGSLRSSPGAMGDGMGDQLQELLQRATIDLPEDPEFMLPPPAKKPHGSTPPFVPPTPSFLPPTPSHSPTPTPSHPLSLSPSPSLTPRSSPPPRMKVEHVASTPPSTPSPMSSPVEHKPPSLPSSWSKSRGPLLFGKHEDEIIHKLVVPRPGASTQPTSRDKLVSMPVEEFNQLLEQTRLSDIEVAFMKEWRRRGKNKTAAQVARKRKREELSDLDGEVSGLQRQRAQLQSQYDRLRSEVAALRERTVAAEEGFYQRYRTQRGAAVSRDSHSIHVTGDGRVMLVPRTSSQVLMLK